MLDRRQVLGAGVIGSILPLGVLASAAEAAQPLGIYRAVYDLRFASGRAFAAEAARRGWTTAAIEGDVTDLWYRDLDLRWKKGPAPIVGVTAPEALFVLDHLARGAGMRVISSEPSAQERTVSWLIAPTARAVRA
jgi:hypothetical protein